MNEVALRSENQTDFSASRRLLALAVPVISAAALLGGCEVSQPQVPSTISAEDRFYQDFVAGPSEKNPRGSKCLASTQYNTGRVPVFLQARITPPDANGVITVKPIE